MPRSTFARTAAQVRPIASARSAARTRAIACRPSRSSCARRPAATWPSTASCGRRSFRCCFVPGSSRAPTSPASASASSVRRASFSSRASCCSPCCASPRSRWTSWSWTRRRQTDASRVCRQRKARAKDKRRTRQGRRRSCSTTISTSASDDLPESVGGPLKKRIDRFNQLPRDAEDRADSRRRDALWSVRDVRAASRVRRAAQDRVSRAPPPLPGAPAALWRAPGVRRAQSRVPVRRRHPPLHRSDQSRPRSRLHLDRSSTSRGRCTRSTAARGSASACAGSRCSSSTSCCLPDRRPSDSWLVGDPAPLEAARCGQKLSATVGNAKMRRMFDRIREDIAVVFDRDPAARTKWEVLTCYPGLHALVWHRAVPHRLVAFRIPLARPMACPLGPLADRNRNPSRRDDRAASVHRSRDGCRDRRDRRDRRRLHALPRRHARRNLVERRQTPSDAGQGSRHRRRREDTRPDPRGRRREDRLERGRRSRRSAGGHRGGHSCAHPRRSRRPSGARTMR